VNDPRRTTFADGLLLRAVDYAEADRIVTLFTKELGKVSLIAYGARKSRRRFQGALEPFSLLKAEIKLGRRELGQLVQAQISRAFPHIIENLKSIQIAGAALDLIRTATPTRDPSEDLFGAAVDMLELLDKNAQLAEQAFLCFQVHVMKLTGFAPCFDLCGKCRNRARDTQPGHFDPAAGFMVCRVCGQAPVYLSAATRRRLMSALGPNWHGDMSGWTSEQLQEARTAMSLFIAHRFAH
jgi:DNA repair protein RecO (recombination protein O)